MLINKSNYELFALDYIEGNLDAHTQKGMKAFLQAHPDLEAEIESMQAAMFTFEPEEHIVYENKAHLLKEENETPIVFMQARHWYQMAAAAAIAILLIGFGVGYFAGSSSNLGNGTMVENNNIKEEKSDISTSAIDPEYIEKEIVAEVSIPSNDESIKSDQVQSNVDKKVNVKPLVVKNQLLPSIATLESENIDLVKPVERKVESVTEELEIIERVEAIAITPLPRVEVNITINSVQSMPKSSIITNSDSKDLIAHLNADIRINNKLSKIKGFLGKLPFEDATLEAFVPTYFASAD